MCLKHYILCFHVVSLVVSVISANVFLCFRCIRSTASASVILTAAVAPPLRALMDRWRILPFVPTTATTLAARHAMQRYTDRWHTCTLTASLFIDCFYIPYTNSPHSPVSESNSSYVERHGAKADRVVLHGWRHQQHSHSQPWWDPPSALKFPSMHQSPSVPMCLCLNGHFFH